MSTSRVQALQQALDARQDWLVKADNAETNCVRLLHGTVEGAPGTTVDRYGPILLIQTWRDPMEPGEIDDMHAVVDAVIPGLIPVWNNRTSGRRGGAAPDFTLDHKVDLPDGIVGLEEGLSFDVNPRHRGRDPLLFLDFRAGRRHIR
ncbi:MAG: 23S rRNA (cytosine1962-C5)-methyltransferase, partial [Myxococcota bacterium]